MKPCLESNVLHGDRAFIMAENCLGAAIDIFGKVTLVEGGAVTITPVFLYREPS